MKKYYLIFFFVFLYHSIVNGQKEHKYLFKLTIAYPADLTISTTVVPDIYFSGSDPVGTIKKSDTTSNSIKSLTLICPNCTLAYEPSKSYDWYQSSLELSCYITPKTFTAYWIPGFKDLVANEVIPSSASNPILSSSSPSSTKDIDVESSVVAYLDGDYTGNDIQWYILHGSTEVYLSTGGTLNISAVDLLSKLPNSETTFIIRAKTPNYTQSGQNIIKSYKNYDVTTQPLKIKPKTLNINNIQCDRYMKVNVISPYSTSNIIYQASSGSSNNYMDIFPASVSCTALVTITAKNISDIGIDPTQNFNIKAVYADNRSLQYAEIKTGQIFLPPLSNAEVTGESFCSGTATTGRIKITRDIANTKEIFQLKQPNCSTSIIGVENLTLDDNLEGYIINVPAGSYCVTQSRTGHLECETTIENIEVKQYSRPSITNIIPKSVSCPGYSNGSITMTVNNPNRSSTQRIYVGSNYTAINNSAASYGHKISPLTTSTYQIRIVDGYGCQSPAYPVPIDNANPVSFDADLVKPSCPGDKDGEIILKSLTGGATYLNNNTKVYLNGSLHGSWPNGQSTFSLGKNFNGTDNYSLYVIKSSTTDTNTCKSSVKNNVIGNPAKILFDEAEKFRIEEYSGYGIKCRGDANGRVYLYYATGGTGTINYHLIDPNGNNIDNSTNNYFQYLDKGLYSGYLTDSKGCSSDTVKGINLTEPPMVTMTPSVTNVKCQGTNDGAIDATLSGVTRSINSYEWRKDNVFISNAEDISNREPGWYTLRIYDNLLCMTEFAPVKIGGGEKITVTVSKNSPSCIGYNDGSLSLTGISKGTAPYYYIFNNTNTGNIFPLPGPFTGLQSGSYTLELRDANYQPTGVYSNCKSDTIIELTDKTQAFVNATTTSARCHDESSGSIDVASVTGPDFPYIEAWLDEFSDIVGSGNELNNIHAGEYSARIKDDRNCTIIQDGFYVPEPPLLIFDDVDIEKASCPEIGDGKLTILASGGTAPYSYSSNNGINYYPANIFENKAKGVYLLKIRDSKNCEADTSVEIPAGSIGINSSKQNVICFGQNNGKIQLNASGSKTGNYSYFLQSPPVFLNNNTGTFNNLGVRTYKLVARDISGCLSDTITETVSQPDPLSVQLSLVDSAACERPIGKIGYNVAGGNGFYKYTWSKTGIGVLTSFNPLALTAGTYNLNITDTLGCTAGNSIVVPDRLAPSITGFTLVKQPWCDMDLGAAKVNVTSGSPPYRYLWNTGRPADSLMTVSNIKEGTYRVTVTDRYLCVDEDETTLIDGPDIGLTYTSDSAHCGQKDGGVDLSANGGIKPYQFRWPDSIASQPVSNNIMNGLQAGIYSIYIIDSIGCERPFNVTVNDIDGPVIQKTELTKAWCGLPTGTVKAFSTGGTGALVYYCIGNGLNLEMLNGYTNILSAGNYIIRVSDAENCLITKSIEITDSAELQPAVTLLSVDSAACDKPLGSASVEMTGGLPPYSYLWNNGVSSQTASGLIKGVYKVIGTDQRGCRDSINISLPDRKRPQLVLLSTESAYCGFPDGKATVAASLGKPPYIVYPAYNPSNITSLGYTDSLSAHSGIIEGFLPSQSPYAIMVADSDGCTGNQVYALINNNNPLTLVLTDVNPVSCFNGSDGRAVVSANYGVEPYSYQWTPVTSNSNINENLPAGPFTATVIDSEGCAKTINITSTPITQPSPLAINSSFISAPVCHNDCNGYITPFAMGGNGGYIYIWNGSDTVQAAGGLCAGTHLLLVKDSKGCELNESYILENPAPITKTNVPDEITVCSGQQYRAVVDDIYSNVIWSSAEGVISEQAEAVISTPGLYFINAENESGCQVNDTFRLLVSDNLLNAEFLMMSETYAGDTVVIIEVSWPQADNCKWYMPEGIDVISDAGFFKEIVFEEPGNYYVELEATLAGCSSIRGKNIEVYESDNPFYQQKSAGTEGLITSFSAYPNPADENINLKIKLSKEESVIVEIISITGNKLTFSTTLNGLDEYLIPVDLSALSYGNYLVRLISGAEVQTKIIMVK